MRFFRRYPPARQLRPRRSLRPLLERLEVHLAMSSTALAAVDSTNAGAVVVEPDLQLVTAVAPSSTVVRSQSSVATSPSGYTPDQIRSAYGIDKIAFGLIVGDGDGQTIAVVDAYDDPGLVDSSSPAFGSSDLARFDQAFGLPDPPSFVKLNEYGSPVNLPSMDPAGTGNFLGNWELEEALDVEWAHAIAPAASVVLIETNSDSGGNMYTGAMTAAAVPGVSVVSMSWGSSEYAGEQSFDSDFSTPSGHQSVTFVAATGDNGGPGEYPAYSPNVVAAGGTTLSLGVDGSYAGETAWSDGGGGISADEVEPAYQNGVQNSGMRSIPDMAFDADPSTGVAVYDSEDETSANPWSQVGGTSLSAPCLAALIAVANQGRLIAGRTTLDGPSQTIPALYSIARTDDYDVTSGSNGTFAAGPGYDEATGLGTPRAGLFVSDLAAYGAAGKMVVLDEPPASVAAGSAFGLSVLVENKDGSLDTSYEGNVTLALAENPAGGTLGGTITAAVQGGIATFSNVILDRAGSGYALLLNAGGSAFATTGAFSVSPATPARLVVISGPTNRVVAGQAFSLIVAVEDVYGNLETSFDGTVSASLKRGAEKGSLSGTRLVTISQGRAVFSTLILVEPATRDAIELKAGPGLGTPTSAFKVVRFEGNLAKAMGRGERILSRRSVHTEERHAGRHA